MKWIRRYIIISILFLISQAISGSESIDSLFVCAEQSYQDLNFGEAALCYERIVFQTNDTEILARALLGKSKCLKQTGNFHEALGQLNRYRFYNLSPNLNNQILYEKSLLCFLLKDQLQALQHFERIQLNQLTTNPGVFLLGAFIYNELRIWDSAKYQAKKYVTELQIAEKGNKVHILKNLDSLYSIQPKMKRVKKGQVLSFILPGSGQTYAGKPVEGVWNLSLNTASAIAALQLLEHSLYFTGMVGGVGLFMKFYFGGIARTTYLIEERNQKRADAYNKILSNLLLNIDSD